MWKRGRVASQALMAGHLLTRSCPDHACVEIVRDRGVNLGQELLELDRPVLSNPFDPYAGRAEFLVCQCLSDRAA